MQVAVQFLGLGLSQQVLALAVFQCGYKVLVDQLHMVRVDAEFQRRAVAVTGLGVKHAVQICAVRRAVCKADIAVGVQHLAAYRLDEGIGQVLRTGLQLDIPVGLGAGAYQRDRRQRQDGQQHHTDDQLHQRGAALVLQLLHGVASPASLA